MDFGGGGGGAETTVPPQVQYLDWNSSSILWIPGCWTSPKRKGDPWASQPVLGHGDPGRTGA